MSEREDDHEPDTEHQGADAESAADESTVDAEDGHGESPSGPLSERAAIAVSAVVGIAVTIAALVAVRGFDVFYEKLPRIQPTVEGGGVGTDWVGGMTRADLAFLIDLIHVVDVVMGLFILVMVFIHWGAFRRLAARMQPPGGELATDGGERDGDTTTPDTGGDPR